LEAFCTVSSPATNDLTASVQKAIGAFRQHGGTMRMSEAIAAGIHRRTLYSMRDDGVLEQLSRGLYRLADAAPLANPDLVTVARKIPEGVICLISALAFYELTTQIPHEVYVAIPRNREPPRLDYPPVRPVRLGPQAFSEGIEIHMLDHVPVRVYSREKTLADCFKFRHKIGLDTTIEALRRYKERGKVNLQALLRAAEVCRVAKVMQPYLEAIV
jgi:predicted transcriptional regulator of viral defense system